VNEGEDLLRLDHFVIHIDHDPKKLNELKMQLDEYDIPFDPEKGKGTSGFKVANLWIGDQYLELPYLKKADGGGWKQEWVHQYNRGRRGIFGLCLYTDSLDKMKQELIERGVELEGPERVTFKMLGGLLKKSLPFRKIYTKPIPNSDLQFMFLQMDDPKKFAFTRKYFMKPNTEEVGIISINEAFVMKDFSNEEWGFINNVFPQLKGNRFKKTMDMGETKLHFVQDPKHQLSVDLRAKANNKNYENIEIEIENVRLLFG
jgi:hypothetical protein